MKYSYLRILHRIGRVMPCQFLAFEKWAVIVLALYASPINVWAGPLTIDSIHTETAICLNDGTATFFVSGGDSSVPYQYALDTAATSNPQWQNSSNFYSLHPGTYHAYARDITGQQVTQTFTVSGNYTSAVINQVVTTAPSCPGGQDASIEIQYTLGSRPNPYFTLFDSSASNLVAGPQPGPVFTNLSSGTYTCRITDSCGIDVNYIAIIAENNTPHVILNTKIDSFGCDSSRVRISASHAQLPMTVQYYPISSPSQISSFQSSSSTAYLQLPNDSVFISLTDACGRMDSATIEPGQITTNLQSFSNSCGYSLEFIHPHFYCDSIVYAYKLNTDSVWTYSGITTPVLPQGYYDTKIINTCCGTEYPYNFTVMPIDHTITVNIDHNLYNCVDSTTGIRVTFNNAHNLNVVFKGPALDTLTGTADNNGQTFLPLIQPDDTLTVKKQTTLEEFNMVNVPIGSYTFQYWDDCDTAIKTLQVNVSDVKNYNPFALISLGCPGNNSISLGMGSVNYFTRGKIKVIRLSDQSIIHSANTYGKDTILLNSLASGDYQIQYDFTGSNKIYYNKAYACPNTLNKTAQIAAYQPPQITADQEYDCGNGQATIIVQASGQSPLIYALREKGTSTFGAPQSSPTFFSLDTSKIYEVQVTDVCTNNAIVEVNDLGALTHPQIFTGTDCVDTSGTASYIILSTYAYAGATYAWTDSAQNLLSSTSQYHMSPVVAGTYWAYVSIPGDSATVCTQDSTSLEILSDQCSAIAVNLAEEDWSMYRADCQNLMTYTHENSTDVNRVWLQRKNILTDTYEDIHHIDIADQKEEFMDYYYIDQDFGPTHTQTYRLRLELRDKSIRYSPIRVVANSCKTSTALSPCKIYPNPSHDQVYLCLSPDISNPIHSVRFYDALGRIALTVDISSAPDHIIPIDLSTLSSGMYYIQLLDGFGQYRIATPLEIY